MAPFGGKMIKSMAQYTLKWQRYYIDKIGALPFIIQTCQNCDSVISTSNFMNFMNNPYYNKV
ncbi:MAG: hypothetical protein BAJALOKI1v1_20051 [Promethearchaeota archaeon]|nr:MAG: hypothetical protein BAJALOKI1v1_20051 [Candidatus Lokiarchaeota archaeon]